MLENLAIQYGTPLYVYDAKKIINQYSLVKESFDGLRTKILFAMKSNNNPEILKTLLSQGSGVDTVSLGEAKLALEVGFRPENIIFTPASTDEKGIRFALNAGIVLNVGSLAELEKVGQIQPGAEVSIRVNPNVGGGHHEHNITGGTDSKFGIDYTYSDQVKEIVKKYDLKLIGTQTHIGSGILDIETYLQMMDIILDTAKDFEDLKFVDFGGGFGIPYKPDEVALDLKELGKKAKEKFEEFRKTKGNDEVEMWIEPGRVLLAESGVLLTKVNAVKNNPQKTFVMVDSGYSQLVRPMLYGSYHEIVNISNPDAEKKVVTVGGNICESGDVFAKDREIAEPREGDILAIMNAGAYSMAMASNYNLHLLPAEVLIESDGSTRLIRKRQTFEDVLRNWDLN